jgi:hypothetical protein
VQKARIWLTEHGMALSFLAAVWLLMIVIANPTGSFPLNDDWNYARTVKSLLEEHKVIITQWSLAASLTHTLFGFLVCLPFGFSFEALRISTACLGYIAAVAAYLLCLKTGAPRTVCIVLSVLLLINPLFFNLSLSFMTDVPFLSLAAIELLLLQRLLKEPETFSRSLLPACLAATAACLIRQTGVVIPISFALICLLAPRSQNVLKQGATAERRQIFLTALSPLLSSVAAVAIFQLWLGHTVGSLYSYQVEQFYLQQVFSKGPVFVLLIAAAHGIDVLVYLGLFALPAIPVIFPRFLSVLDRPQRFFAIALAAECGFLLILGLLFSGLAMPLVDNVFYNFGLGPLLVGETHLPKTGWPEASKSSMVMLGLVGAGFSGFISSITVILLMRWRKGQLVLGTSEARCIVPICLTVLALYLPLICIRGFFDRYLIFPFLLLLPILAAAYAQLPASAQNEPTTDSADVHNIEKKANPSRLALLAAFLLALPLAYFSIAATHDYFEWNRIRWQALNRLTDKQNISPLDIDGGLEFNGWYAYDPRFRKQGVVFNTAMTHQNNYLIAFSSVPGFEIVERYKFQRWIPSGFGELFVLKKLPTDTNSVHPKLL